MDQHCGNRGIHATGETADHPPLPYLRAHTGDFGFAETRHGPAALAAADIVGKIAQQRGAVRCVRHFHMKLHRIEIAGFVGDRGKGRAFADGHNAETRRERGDFIAVAHPDLFARTLVPHPREQGTGLRYHHLGAAEFAVAVVFYLAAQLHAHGLLAIANAKHGQAGGEYIIWRARRTIFKHAGGAA